MQPPPPFQRERVGAALMGPTNVFRQVVFDRVPECRIRVRRRRAGAELNTGRAVHTDGRV